jgi:hypothetical protein
MLDVYQAMTAALSDSAVAKLEKKAHWTRKMRNGLRNSLWISR